VRGEGGGSGGKLKEMRSGRAAKSSVRERMDSVTVLVYARYITLYVM
jgi:hypothetical protein